MDKAKRQKQDEEEDRLKKLAQEAEDLETQKTLEREKLIKGCLEKLPAEPDNSATANTITRIRFRLPNGETLQRKFFIVNSLQTIVDYLTSNGYFSEEFKILSSWPRLIFIYFFG